MLPKQEVVAMLLAGGQGSRLGVLTRNLAKPAVPFGGKYRIIDFPLSNCVNSRHRDGGCAHPVQPLELNDYIGNGAALGPGQQQRRWSTCCPLTRSRKDRLVQGHGNAIYQNIPLSSAITPITWWCSPATTSTRWITQDAGLPQGEGRCLHHPPCTRCPWQRPPALAF